MNEKSLTEKASLLVIFSIILIAIYLSLKYLFPILLPFILAYLLSLILLPISKALNKKAEFLDKPITVTVLVFIIIGFLIIVRYTVEFAYSEVIRIAESVSADIDSPDNPVRLIIDYVNNFGNKIPFLSKLNLDEKASAKITDMVNGIISNGALKISTFFTDFAADFIKSFPSFVLSFFVFLSALFYFSLDRGKFSESLREFLPHSTLVKVKKWRMTSISAIKTFAKSYLLMTSIVFAQLYLGLTLTGIHHSFVLALIISFVDLLPVLGVGTVLVPASLFALISGNTKTGIGLLITFAVIAVDRQFIEPHIIGNTIGVHPIIALFAVYFGFELFGISGLIAVPLALFIFRSVKIGENRM